MRFYDLSEDSKSELLGITGETKEQRWEFLYNVVGDTFEWDYEEGVSVEPFIPKELIPDDLVEINDDYLSLEELLSALATKHHYIDYENEPDENKIPVLELIREELAEIYSKFDPDTLERMLEFTAAVIKEG